MDYKYNHPLYTEDDKDIALVYLTEYMENNNIPEHKAISNDPFEYTMPSIPREMTKRMIEMQYGVNIITMANFLNMQDIFFRDYMPHISKYLNFLGIDFDFSYIRMAKLMPTYLVHMFSHNNRTIPLKYWDPNIFWTDFNYKKDNPDLNITNPITNFYTATLNLYDITNHEFIRVMDVLNGIENRVLEDGKGYNINIKMLPTSNPSYMMQVTKIIHKCF